MRRKGEALHEDREPLSVLLDEREADPSVFSTQYQQNPVPSDGRRINVEWFKRYEVELISVFEKNVWPLGADFEPHWCLVLSLDTRLAAIT